MQTLIVYAHGHTLQKKTSSQSMLRTITNPCKHISSSAVIARKHSECPCRLPRLAMPASASFESPPDSEYDSSRSQFAYFDAGASNPIFAENAGGSQVALRTP